jgi:KUP system potassium uptake protein
MGVWDGAMTDIAVGERKPASSISRPITAAAALAALGIVYGDLGTSPLYTLTAIIDSVGGKFTPETVSTPVES